jgi:hypothetical protein
MEEKEEDIDDYLIHILGGYNPCLSFSFAGD